MSKRIIRTVFSCILSLFIAILFLFGILCHFIQHYIFDKDMLLQACTESGFTQELYEEIRYNWENYISITGISDQQDILQLLTPEQVQADTLQYIDSCYSGTATVQTAELRSRLEEKIRDYAYSHNITAMPEAELEANIKDLTDACISSYSGSISIPTLPRLLGAINDLSDYPEYGIISAGIGIFLILLFLFFLQQRRHNTLYYATLSAATPGIILVGAVHLSTYYNLIARIPVSESALKTLLTSYLQFLLDKLAQYGYQCMLVAGTLLAVYLLISLVILIVKAAQNRKQIA